MMFIFISYQVSSYFFCYLSKTQINLLGLILINILQKDFKNLFLVTFSLLFLILLTHVNPFSMELDKVLLQIPATVRINSDQS